MLLPGPRPKMGGLFIFVGGRPREGLDRIGSLSRGGGRGTSQGSTLLYLTVVVGRESSRDRHNSAPTILFSPVAGFRSGCEMLCVCVAACLVSL